VSSVQAYYLPDGRPVLVNMPPQLGVVRDLVAQHAVTFSGHRAVLTQPVSTPSWGGQPWGGNWFGFDD
jgi:hypothetical protein